MNYSAIPQQLRDRSQWLLFDRDADTPRRPHWDGDFSVSWSAPKAWHSFDEATAKASEKDSWGVGYVCAAANDDHPMGVMSVIDIDGGATPDDSPKDWLPGLQPFGDHDAYLEWSASHDDADCAYETWRNIGFALADEFPERTAQRLFEQWSRGTSKYDEEAEKLIQDISSRGTGKVTIGTLIHHATQAGWQPSGKEPQVLDAAAEADEEPPDHAPKAPEAETGTDGGTVAENADSTAGPRSLDDRIRDAITAAENDDRAHAI